MKYNKDIGLQALVFSLVAAAFTSIYITQPVLPVLADEFGVNEARASLTISMVVLGIALANLPFGSLADRRPIKPIIVVGGLVVAACSIICSLTSSIYFLVSARFVQGLFIPSLTTCLAAYLAKSLPQNRLNVVMGSYVSATVVGGLGGRLLGGLVHPPLHWRYAFVSSSAFLALAILAAALWLPKENRTSLEPEGRAGFIDLLKRPELLRIYFVSFSAFFVFSSTFNFLPFYLSGPPFFASTKLITFMYLSYIIGVIMGPLAGALSNKIGNGSTMALGSLVFAIALGLSFIPSFISIVAALACVCAGFFAIHASAAGALNRKLETSRGRANSLYVLFYYLGGYTGITVSSHAYVQGGWPSVAAIGLGMLLIPFGTGIFEYRIDRKRSELNP